MDLLWLGVLQLGLLFGVMELFVRCMPSALWQTSEQNCYRMDGTRSEHRTFREFRARNRLRCDMLAALVIVLLIGNALYVMLDRSVAPMSNVASVFWQEAAGSSVRSTSVNYLDSVIEKDQKNMLVTSSQFNRHWPWLIVAMAGWLAVSLLFVGQCAQRAYRTFAKGVRARSNEYFKLDMTRRCISEPELVSELLGAKKDVAG